MNLLSGQNILLFPPKKVLLAERLREVVRIGSVRDSYGTHIAVHLCNKTQTVKKARRQERLRASAGRRTDREGVQRRGILLLPPCHPQRHEGEGEEPHAAARSYPKFDPYTGIDNAGYNRRVTTLRGVTSALPLL